jgi:hypothetical protein
MTLTTTIGFRDAIAAASDLGAFAEDSADEYSRGQAELIADLYILDDPDPGSGEAYAFIRDEIIRCRRH